VRRRFCHDPARWPKGPASRRSCRSAAAREAVEFYKAAFGAVEVYRVGGDDDTPSVVSQLTIGNATFWVADESPEYENFSPEYENFSPESVGGSTTWVLLVVEDPDARRSPGRSRPARPRCIRRRTRTGGDWGGSPTRSSITGKSGGRWSTGRRTGARGAVNRGRA
jgi:hypothetical protein